MMKTKQPPIKAISQWDFDNIKEVLYRATIRAHQDALMTGAYDIRDLSCFILTREARKEFVNFNDNFVIDDPPPKRYA